jgi:hypothetical protein
VGWPRKRELTALYPCPECGALATMQAHCEDCRTKQHEAGIYLPTADEIRAACLRIQAGWTEAERISRRGGFVETVPADTPIVKVRECG